MKIFLVPFLLVAAESALPSPLRRSGGSSVIMHEYLFDGLVDDGNMDSEGRTLEDRDSQPIGYRKYELEKVLEVEGRQGIATNGTHYFVSGSTALYIYSKEGILLKSNEDPFVDLEKPANHFGDIGYYNGTIYTGVEWFEDGRGEDIQIALYDAETLNFTQVTFPWEPESGQVEVSALTIDTDNELVWMTDWVSSNYIYSYNLTTGEYTGKLHLRGEPEWTQGIAYYKGDLYITADDGNADRKEYDNLWRIPADELASNATYIRHELSFEVPEDFPDFGEIEGIDFNKDTNEMLVLANRGKQIVLGMAKGLYPGYDREIHEVFVFRIIDVDSSDESSVEDNAESFSAAPLALTGRDVFVAIIASIGVGASMILN